MHELIFTLAFFPPHSYKIYILQKEHSNFCISAPLTAPEMLAVVESKEKNEEYMQMRC